MEITNESLNYVCLITLSGGNGGWKGLLFADETILDTELKRTEMKLPKTITNKIISCGKTKNKW